MTLHAVPDDDTPHHADIGAERAVLAAILTDPPLWQQAADAGITADTWVRPAHQQIWAATTTLHAAGQPADPISINAQLVADRVPLDVITRAMPDLITHPARLPDITWHAARLVALHRRRQAAEHLSRAAQQLNSPTLDDDPANILDGLHGLLSPAQHHDSSSWQHQDLTDVLAGGETDPPPSQLRRSDGAYLLYDGHVHTFAGEPTSGKTWLALTAIIGELANGLTVAMIDFEDRASRVIGRLLQLGGRPEWFTGDTPAFRYIRPDQALDSTSTGHLLAEVDGCALTIIDGVTEAMTMHSLDLNSNTDIATFLALLPRRIADTGSTVVMIDHVVKDDERQGRWALGGGHKLAGLDGVSYTIKSVEPFGRGKKGTSRVIIGKDRPGFIEEIALGRTAAEFHIDARNPDILAATLDPPLAMPTAADGQMRPTVLMGKVATWVLTHPDSSRKQIESNVRGNATYVRLALDMLVNEGYIEARPGPRNAQLHRLLEPFDPTGETHD